MPRRYVLAIDQGTTGSTAIVFDDGGARARAGVLGVHPALSEAGLGRARSDGDLAREPQGDARRRCARRKLQGRRPGGDRHHQPARDDGAVGPQRPASRCTAPSSGRIAAPPTCARASRPTAPRRWCAARPAWWSTPTSPAPSCAGCSTTCAGAAPARRPRLRHHRQLADLEAHRRPRPRHRPHQRLAHAAVRHPPPRLGPRAARPARRAPTACCRAWCPRAASSRTTDAARARRRGADRRHRRRPAGGAVRPGLLPPRAW